jgi:hypothetical protein
MKKRKIINIFLLASIILLILAAVRFGLFGRLIRYAERYSSLKQSTEDDSEYPDHIYETFTDGERKEISVKMEKKTGTIDGEEVIFYEDTVESEVIKYNFYKGTVKTVNSEEVVVLVDKECLNADPDSSYYKYEDINDYELIFYFEDYSYEYKEYGLKDRISINTIDIINIFELREIIGKYIRVCDSEYKDPIVKVTNCQLDFYHN